MRMSSGESRKSMYNVYMYMRNNFFNGQNHGKLSLVHIQYSLFFNAWVRTHRYVHRTAPKFWYTLYFITNNSISIFCFFCALTQSLSYRKNKPRVLIEIVIINFIRKEPLFWFEKISYLTECTLLVIVELLIQTFLFKEIL